MVEYSNSGTLYIEKEIARLISGGMEQARILKIIKAVTATVQGSRDLAEDLDGPLEKLEMLKLLSGFFSEILTDVVSDGARQVH